MRTVHRKLLAGVAALALALVQTQAWGCCTPEGTEEFIGPFANWATCTGLSGNGSTNDSTALQACITALSSSSPTMWLPAPSVCYNITTQLTFANLAYMRIFGASPSTTPICAGTASMGMLLANGSPYSTIGRLTFNGENTAVLDVNQSWDGTTGSFDTEMSYPDVVFENAQYGYVCGYNGGSGQGCAETTLLRDTFSNNSVAGQALGNFNALDIFTWYGTFSGNYDGVQNTLTAGNFHVYNSNFSGSTDADLSLNNTGTFNFRWNYSSGSAAFLGSGGSSGNPCNLNLQGNTILDYTDTSAINVGCYGPVMMVDNTIRSLLAATGPVVNLSLTGGSIISVGNEFTIPDTIVTSSGQWISLFDTVVSRSTVNPSAPTLPSTPPNEYSSRSITEVAAGSSSSTIQTDITNACSSESGDGRPVVHLQAGSYTNISLTIPANCDVQLIGDGYYSVMTGTGSGPVIALTGPNFATLREFSINGNGNVGITTSGIDQAGGRVFMEGVNLNTNAINMSVNGLADAIVEAHDFFESGATGASAVVVTGPTGTWNGGGLNVFAGASSGDVANDYSITNGAYVSIRDTWYDIGAGGYSRAIISGVGGATTFWGDTDNETSHSGTPSYSVTNYSGVSALLGGLVVIGPVTFSGGGNNNLSMGMDANDQIQTQATGNYGAFITYEHAAGGNNFYPNLSNYSNQSFFLSALNQARTALPSIPGSPLLPSGATDERFYRVTVLDASVGISINP